MSEARQENTANIGLPKKTKIAVWWLRLIGVVLIIWYFICLVGDISMSGSSTWDVTNHNFILLIGSIFYFISGFLISKQSKKSWIVPVFILFIVAICSLIDSIFIVIHMGDISYMMPITLLIGSLIYLTPPILIFVDRNNYLEMQKENEKGNS